MERDDVWERHVVGKRERDRLLLALFAYAGLRRSKLLGLDWDHVDLERRVRRVRRASGGRQRVVPIHPALVPPFLDYLPFRARDPEPALFVGVRGKRLSQTIMTQTFLCYARAEGVTERKRRCPLGLPLRRRKRPSTLVVPQRLHIHARACRDLADSHAPTIDPYLGTGIKRRATS